MTMLSNTRRVLYKSLSCMLVSSALLSACQDSTSVSTPSVTEVPGSRSKRQSIGNCWIYAQASWLESLYFSLSNERINVSESYWTYWDWYLSLTENSYEDLGTVKEENGVKKFEFSTGGTWSRAIWIIYKYGFLYEADFSDEHRDEMSSLQSKALKELQNALVEGGELYNEADRNPENVKKFLNRIFGVNIDSLLPNALKNSATLDVASGEIKKVNKDDKECKENEVCTYKPASKIKVAEAIYPAKWKVVPFPSAEGVTNPDEISEAIKIKRQKILRNVMRALNDHQPVLMSVHVFFNGLKADSHTRRGTFDYETLMQNLPSTPEDQGGHMVLLTDYTVKNVPGLGDIGFGNKTEIEKEAALNGELVTLVSKNSWGFARGPRGLFDGQSDFSIDYLTMPIEKTYGERKVTASTVQNFILPAGYAD